MRLKIEKRQSLILLVSGSRVTGNYSGNKSAGLLRGVQILAILEDWRTGSNYGRVEKLLVRQHRSIKRIAWATSELQSQVTTLKQVKDMCTMQSAFNSSMKHNDQNVTPLPCLCTTGPKSSFAIRDSRIAPKVIHCQPWPSSPIKSIMF